MPLLNEGVYHGTITGWHLSTSTKGNVYLETEVRLSLILQGADWRSLQPQPRRRMRFFLTEKAFGRSRRLLVILGFNGSFRDPQFDQATLQKGATWICKHKFENNKTFEEWHLETEEEPTPPADDVIDQLDQLWKQPDDRKGNS